MANLDIPQLSKEARELLLEAVKDRDGQIMKGAHGGGAFINTNGKPFIEEGNARSRAVWEGAFNELLDNKLIEAVGHKGQIFQVTDRGYDVADRLTAG